MHIEDPVTHVESSLQVASFTMVLSFNTYPVSQTISTEELYVELYDDGYSTFDRPKLSREPQSLTANENVRHEDILLRIYLFGFNYLKLFTLQFMNVFQEDTCK